MLGKELKFLLKHSSIYGIGPIFGQGVGFFLLPIYTRYLAPKDYGVAILVETTVAVIGLFAGMSINEAITRFYYEDNADQKKKLVISTAYIISAVLMLIAVPFLFLLSPLLSEIIFKDGKYSLLFQISAITLGIGLISDIGLIYLRIKARSLRYLLFSLLSLGIMVFLNILFIVVYQTGIIGIFYSGIISRLILFFPITVPILAKVRFGFVKTLAFQMVKFSIPLIFSNIFRILLNESDKYFINYFFSPIETGIYAISSKIGSSIHALVTVPFLQTYAPRRFEIWKGGDFQETYSKILTYYLFFIGTGGLIVSIFADEIIKVMTHENFYEAARYIPLIVLSWIFFGVKYHFEMGIMIEKKTKNFLYINGLSSLIIVLLNSLLIPQYKIWGALISLNGSVLFTTISTYYISQKIFRIHFDFKPVIRLGILLSVTFAISTLISMDYIVLNLFLKVCLIGTYFILVILWGVVEKEHWLFLKTSIGRYLQMIWAKFVFLRHGERP